MIVIIILLLNSLFTHKAEFSMPEDRNTYYLTGGSTKSWHPYNSTPEDKECATSPLVTKDNVYNFAADGSFEFDSGTVTEDPNCTLCCTDLVNILGEWKFTKGGRGIRIIALHEKGKKGNNESIVLYDALIEHLDENTLTISQLDKASNIRHTVEFRVKEN